MDSASVAAVVPSQPRQPLIVIEPSRGWVSLRLHDLWEYRELLYFMTWRDIKVRYKQTALGAAWAIIQPVFTMLVFSLFFGKLGKIPSDGIPYPIFSYAGLLPWNYFAYSMQQSSNSLVGSATLIRKIYFPRLVIPLASVLAGLLDMAISFTVLLGMMFYYKVYPGTGLLLLPAFLLVTIIAAEAVGLWLSALNVEYRDVRFAVPFLTQFWMFATPVAYPSSMLHGPWRTLFGLNPMVGAVEGFRWALLGTRPPGGMVLVSTAASLVMLITGAYYFRRMERRFADII